MDEEPTADPNAEREPQAQEPSPVPTPQNPDQRIKVMLLGSGDLSRELAVAFQRLDAEVIAAERYADAPAHGVADQSLVVELTDPGELWAAIDRVRPDFVVTVSEGVATDALAAAAENVQIVPSPRSIRLSADREGLRRLAADELGLPTAPFWFVGSADELKAVAAHAGFPLVVTPTTAPVGVGQSTVSGPEQLEPAWQRAVSAGDGGTPTRVLAETAVEIDFHVTLLTVRTKGPAGPVIEFCSPIGHDEPSGDLLESWQPQQMSEVALDAAKSIAARIVKALDGWGVFGVELMVRGDEIYFRDVTAHPYESALVTLRTQRLSEFELQARAVLGLPVDTIMISPGAAQVIYASPEPATAPAEAPAPAASDTAKALADALAVPESDFRIFADHQAQMHSALRVALATAPDVPTARGRARQVAAALRRFRQR